MQLTREHTLIIFEIRTRMFEIKDNFKNKYKSSLNLRLCKAETQIHSLDQCSSLDVIRKQHRFDKHPIQNTVFQDSSMETPNKMSKYVIKLIDLLVKST